MFQENRKEDVEERLGPIHSLVSRRCLCRMPQTCFRHIAQCPLVSHRCLCRMPRTCFRHIAQCPPCFTPLFMSNASDMLPSYCTVPPLFHTAVYLECLRHASVTVHSAPLVSHRCLSRMPQTCFRHIAQHPVTHHETT